MKSCQSALSPFFFVRKERLSRGVLSETEFLHFCREFEDFPHCQSGGNSLPTMESCPTLRTPKAYAVSVGRRSGHLAHRLPEVCRAGWCWKVAAGQSANCAEDGQNRLAGIGITVWQFGTLLLPR